MTNGTEADFTGASMTETMWDDSVLTNSTFDEIWAERTSFVGADLTGSSFQHATIIDANFTGATLTDVNFTDTFYTPGTTWPLGFKPEAHGAIRIEKPPRKPKADATRSPWWKRFLGR